MKTGFILYTSLYIFSASTVYSEPMQEGPLHQLSIDKTHNNTHNKKHNKNTINKKLSKASKIIQSHVIKEKGPASIWESKNSDAVYLVSLDSPLLTIVDSNRDYLTNPPIDIDVGKGAFGVIANQDDSKAFVTNVTQGTVSVINVEEKRVISVIELDPNSKPYCEVFSNNEESLYVVSWASESVYVIDPVKHDIKKKIRVGDLSHEFQLNNCYKSCHEEKRAIIKQIIAYKRNSTNIIPAVVARNHTLR